MDQPKFTILCCRLSNEDSLDGESNRIANQRSILTRYAQEHGFQNIRILADDGYTGTNFDRPGIQEALSLVEQGLVENFIFKVMSRFGRDYLQVGHYIELIFPSHDVRFIAVNDHIIKVKASDEISARYDSSPCLVGLNGETRLFAARVNGNLAEMRPAHTDC